MKHYIIEVIYKAPIEKVQETTEEHRNFLKKGYDKGTILCSGPQVPRIGGIIIAKANSMEEVDKFFKSDPYVVNNLADYRYIEFKPLSHQEFLKKWIEE